MRSFIATLLCVLSVVIQTGLIAQPGSLDLSFDPGVGPNDQVYRVFPQADGKVIIIGSFTEVSGHPRGGVARLMQDGALDLTYAAGAGAIGPLFSGVQQADGKMVVSGNISSFDGISCSHLIRLNLDGSLDLSFQVDLQTYIANGIARDEQGRILIVGGFTYVNGGTCGRILRLNPDGSTDATFDSGDGFDAQANVIRVDQQGRIWVTGYFSYYGPIPAPGIARLLPDGHIDPVFTPGAGPDAVISSMAIIPTGGAVISGVFNYYNNAYHRFVCKLLDNGLDDPSFLPSGPTLLPPNELTYGSNGHVYTGGTFFLNHLFPNGTLDPNFLPISGQVDLTIADVAFTTDGSLLIAGNFNTYLGIQRKHIARINICPTWYSDMDGDGFGSLESTVTDCVQPAGYVAQNNDCDDYDPAVGAGSTWYVDADLDGAGNAAISTVACYQPAGYVTNQVDCNDADPTAQLVQTWYADADNDGFGDPSSGISSCSPIPGRVTDGTDCNDNDANSHPGTTCNDGNSATYFDNVGPDCVCAGIPCAMGPVMQVFPDAFGAQTTWQIYSGNQVVAQGGPYTNGNFDVPPENLCLPEGCYRLVVHDSQGNGMCSGVNGGYVLRVPQDRGGYPIIDNTGTGCFTSNSGIAVTLPTNGQFCLPLGYIKTEERYTEPRQNLLKLSTIQCYEDLDVSAQYGVGNQADDGYQFWIYDPNGGYSITRTLTHASGGNGQVGPTKCCYFKMNYNYNGDGIAQQNQFNKWLNVRVRPLVNGVYGNFGPAYRIWVTSSNYTQLKDEPGDVQHSCEVTRRFGNGTNNKIWCYSIGPSGTPYKFKFVGLFDHDANPQTLPLPGSREISSTSAQLMLNWFQLPLLNGQTYTVYAQAYLNGSWQGYGGAPCHVTINNNPPAAQPRSMMSKGSSSEFLIYPNPNNGDQLFLSLDELADGIGAAALTITDPLGKPVFRKALIMDAAGIDTKVELDRGISNGLYLVQLTVGDRIFTQRLVISR